jgi:hypothetical protein
MRFLTAFIFAVSLLVQVFSYGFARAAFEWNREYIAKNQCENRDRPELGCKGNCVFMKKMREQEKQDQNDPIPLKIEISSIVLSSRSFYTGEVPVPLKTGHGKFIFQNEGKPVDQAIFFFRPPCS